MGPEVLSAIRSLLIAVGAFAVGKGWVDAVGLETIVGGAVALLSAVWGVYAKRPNSGEAQKIADKVADVKSPPL
jgi:hypothetical protein